MDVDNQNTWRALLALAALAVGSASGVSIAAVLPSDPKPICSFKPTEVPEWFGAGKVDPGGSVTPPDSIEFSPKDDCDYYKWSARTFLWLTSPASGGGLTLDTAEFYGISAPIDRKRTFIQNRGAIGTFSLRDTKLIEEANQPDSHSVLMARNGSLVYYATQVNDIYALFLTGVKSGGIPWPPKLENGGTPNPLPKLTFPIEPGELGKISDFARTRNINITPNRLIVEVKSAWIETTGLDSSKYITRRATIPTYDKSNPSRWTPDGGSREAELALVGLHVVGSAKRHTEMIWATFEHTDNAPMMSYSYVNAGNNAVRVDPEPDGKWQFSARNCQLPINQERMHSRNRPYIDAVDPATGMVPSDTCRTNAWGTAPGDRAEGENNARVIAINNNVVGNLASGDMRKNYLLIGATWKAGFGTIGLANTTMETYFQRSATGPGTTCFSCHKGNLEDGKLSHIWGSLQPLPPP